MCTGCSKFRFGTTKRDVGKELELRKSALAGFAECGCVELDLDRYLNLNVLRDDARS